MCGHNSIKNGRGEMEIHVSGVILLEERLYYLKNMYTIKQQPLKITTKSDS